MFVFILSRYVGGVFSLTTDKSYLIQFVIILDLFVTIVNGKELMIVNKKLGLGM